MEGRSIGYEGITIEGLAKGGDMGKRTRHKTLGKMVSVTKLSFREEHILTALAWKIMVLIPKGGVYHIGIGLVEFIWKF